MNRFSFFENFFILSAQHFPRREVFSMRRRARRSPQRGNGRAADQLFSCPYNIDRGRSRRRKSRCTASPFCRRVFGVRYTQIKALIGCVIALNLHTGPLFPARRRDAFRQAAGFCGPFFSSGAGLLRIIISSGEKRCRGIFADELRVFFFRKADASVRPNRAARRKKVAVFFQNFRENKRLHRAVHVFQRDERHGRAGARHLLFSRFPQRPERPHTARLYIGRIPRRRCGQSHQSARRCRRYRPPHTATWGARKGTCR